MQFNDLKVSYYKYNNAYIQTFNIRASTWLHMIYWKSSPYLLLIQFNLLENTWFFDKG